MSEIGVSCPSDSQHGSRAYTTTRMTEIKRGPIRETVKSVSGISCIVEMNLQANMSMNCGFGFKSDVMRQTIILLSISLASDTLVKPVVGRMLMNRLPIWQSISCGPQIKHCNTGQGHTLPFSSIVKCIVSETMEDNMRSLMRR
jgi:hypothetical protein